ncbi:cobalamin biosynthesis protein [Actinospica robiniae]|uniref:cobalamin biosynthesis protein n=1 Tax=Actinospica robiniae TaxID=304901 RepID=UPI0004135BA9|nr:cobalamin biosynthesis protein [Actinospica robiniae]
MKSSPAGAAGQRKSHSGRGRTGKAGAAALATGLLAGYAADTLLADPSRGHPVALFGRAARGLEEHWYQDSRLRGAAFTAACVGGAAALGAAVDRAAGTRRLLAVASTASAAWTVIGAASLRREAEEIGRLLEVGDLEGARERLPRLCGRDARGLGESALARAVIESVAENTSDAVVAPLFWGAVAGTPGLLAYRAANTLDAMVGHRSERYERFGWASARLDDALNLVPARLTGLLTVAAAPRVGGDRAQTWQALRHDGSHHPSPNAGHCEASAAGALGLRLGGTNVYGARVEERPQLGTGRSPRGFDIARATKLSKAVCTSAAVLAAAGALLGRAGRSRRG